MNNLADRLQYETEQAWSIWQEFRDLRRDIEAGWIPTSEMVGRCLRWDKYAQLYELGVYTNPERSKLHKWEHRLKDMDSAWPIEEIEELKGLVLKIKGLWSE